MSFSKILPAQKEGRPYAKGRPVTEVRIDGDVDLAALTANLKGLVRFYIASSNKKALNYFKEKIKSDPAFRFGNIYLSAPSWNKEKLELPKTGIFVQRVKTDADLQASAKMLFATSDWHEAMHPEICFGKMRVSYEWLYALMQTAYKQKQDFFIAKRIDDQKPAGFLWGKCPDLKSSGEIIELWVNPEVRRQGDKVGQLLVRTFRSSYPEQATKLEASALNYNAIRFYQEAEGFSPYRYEFLRVEYEDDLIQYGVDEDGKPYARIGKGVNHVASVLYDGVPYALLAG